jgi:hypothetical protein
MIKYIYGCTLAAFVLAACEKKVDPIDTFSVNVEFKNSGGKFVTGDVELNPKDSFYLDFTVTSGEDMQYVEIQRNGARLDTFRIPEGTSKKSFSKIKGYRADSIPGVYTYRVIGRGIQAKFLGDGDKLITIKVKPDYDLWSYRILFVPDTVAKTNKTYYSTSDGKIYSYSEGAAVSGKIDFGYYWDTTGRSSSSTSDDQKHTIYSLSAPQPQLGFNDISSWTKNVTLLKKMPSSVNFVSQLTSAGAINTLIRNNMASGTSTKVSQISTAAGNNVIGFKTAAGKYGAILIRFVNGDSPAKTTSIEVDVKVQK